MQTKETAQLPLSPLMLQFTFCYCLLKFRPDNYYSMTRKSLIIPLILLTVPLSATSFAQSEPEEDERWFQTEIIVFEIRDKNTIDSQEIWPDDPGLPNYENSIELNPVIEVDLQALTTAGIPGLAAPAPTGSAPEQASNINRLTQADALTAPPDDLSGTLETTAAIDQQTPQELPFQLLPDDALTLTALNDILTDSASYVPILNIAWRQPVAAKEAAQTIYIHSNPGQTALTPTPELMSINSLMAPPALNPDLNPDLNGQPIMFATQNDIEQNLRDEQLNTLEGTIKLHLGRYLHLETDLLYRSQIEPLENNTFFINLDDIEQPQTLFRMHQTRRMRSGELHYFDHPMFGMLVLITPYELPEPEIELEESNELDSVPTDENNETVNTEAQ